MTPKHISLLFLSSSPSDEASFCQRLTEEGYEIICRRIDAEDQLRAVLAENNWDLMVADYTLPTLKTQTALAVLRETGRDIPLIAFSGEVKSEELIDAMRSGITDYVVKTNLARLAPAVERALEQVGARRKKDALEEDRLQFNKCAVIFDSISDMIWIADRELRIQMVNKALASFLGMSPEQVKGRYCYEVFHGRTSPPSDCPCGEPLLKNDPVAHELFDSFRKRYFQISVSPAFDANGDITASVCIARDITDQKKTEEELKLAEVLYRTISENSQSGIIIVQDNTIVYVNPYIASDYGYSLEQLLGRDMRDFIHPDDLQETRRNAIRMLKGESTVPYSYRIVCAGGESRWVVETVSSIEYKGRRAVLGNIMDVTERRLMEKQLADARETLLQSEKLSAIGTLAGGISHEILNPLNIISLTIQMLGLQEWPPDKTKEMLATCEKQIERIEKIARDINTFAKTSKNELQPVNINDLIDSVLALLLPKIRLSRVAVSRLFQDDMPLIPLDQNNIWQVFMNLIHNAIDAMEKTEEKALEITTAIVPSKKGDVARITFNDRGPGIREEEMSRIFDPFFTTKEPGKGTGLGLPIARNIVQEHDGKIWAENNRWGGASFIVELPTGNDR